SIEMTAINEIFLGVHWSLESNEGFDEYLKAKGTPWIVRKAIAAAPHTITWEYLEAHRWLVNHKGIEIYAGVDTITERYKKKKDKEEPEEVYTYHIEKGKLVQEMERDGVTCTRTYKSWRPKN
ncbi:hypothetical protein PFISCL1PPCAC_14215, partial [Pristionchus fissidentatus]